MCMTEKEEFGAKMIYFANLFIYHVLMKLIHFQNGKPAFCSLSTQKNEVSKYVAICCWDRMVCIHTAFINLFRQVN